MMSRCFCCNSELTAPTLINGKTYGYTCAAKIQGGKKSRKYKLVPAKKLKDVFTSSGHKYAEILEIDGEMVQRYVSSDGSIARTININGVLFAEVKR